METHKWKRFDEIEDTVDWLNSLQTMTGSFTYDVEGIFSTPKGVYVVLSGLGDGWDKV